MSNYKVIKDGRHVGDIEADDARKAGPKAVEKWGDGVYDISLIRDEPEERDCGVCGEPFVPERGQDDYACDDCLGDIDED